MSLNEVKVRNTLRPIKYLYQKGANVVSESSEGYVVSVAYCEKNQLFKAIESMHIALHLGEDRPVLSWFTTSLEPLRVHYNDGLLCVAVETIVSNYDCDPMWRVSFQCQFQAALFVFMMSVDESVQHGKYVTVNFETRPGSQYYAVFRNPRRLNLEIEYQLFSDFLLFLESIGLIGAKPVSTIFGDFPHLNIRFRYDFSKAYQSTEVQILCDVVVAKDDDHFSVLSVDCLPIRYLAAIGHYVGFRAWHLTEESELYGNE